MKVLHQSSGDGWALYNADCIDVVASLPDRSVDYTIFSPPFASLYVFSNSDRDMGNVRSHDEFYRHMRFLVPELLRITRPGRLLSFHCMQLPAGKERDGFIGMFDFRGELIRLFVEAGWCYHSEVAIWKDPVAAMHRTKAIGLLYKQLCKDSTMSRQGFADYLVTMRAPGVNDKPVKEIAKGIRFDRYIGTDGPKVHAPTTATTECCEQPIEMQGDPRRRFAIDCWQRYASPVWFDIAQSDTLQRESAREEKDEKHICPLQLGVIRRAIELWTTNDDVVFSPFAGIGSEGYVALQEGRRFVGAELKPSYYKQACGNLASAKKQLSLAIGGL